MELLLQVIVRVPTYPTIKLVALVTVIEISCAETGATGQLEVESIGSPCKVTVEILTEL
jgi:hypothetical protein